MTDKMEQIEAKIKGTVTETTDSVRRMVDIKHQAAEHPWLSVGLAVAAGYVLGSMGDSGSDSSSRGPSFDARAYGHQPASAAEAYQRARGSHDIYNSYGSQGSNMSGQGYGSGQSFGSQDYGSYGQSYAPSSYTGQSYGSGQSFGTQDYTSPSYGSHGQSFGPQSYGSGQNFGGYTGHGYQPGSASNSQRAEPGFLDSISRQFGGEIEMLKTAAVTSLVSMIRDTIRQNVPSLHREMERARTGSGATGATPTGSTAASSYAAGSGSATGSSYAAGSGSTSGGSDYARSAVNNPTHVTGVHDPARGTSGSYETKSGYPEEGQRTTP